MKKSSAVILILTLVAASAFAVVFGFGKIERMIEPKLSRYDIEQKITLDELGVENDENISLQLLDYRSSPISITLTTNQSMTEFFSNNLGMKMTEEEIERFNADISKFQIAGTEQYDFSHDDFYNYCSSFDDRTYYDNMHITADGDELKISLLKNVDEAFHDSLKSVATAKDVKLCWLSLVMLILATLIYLIVGRNSDTLYCRNCGSELKKHFGIDISCEKCSTKASLENTRLYWVLYIILFLITISTSDNITDVTGYHTAARAILSVMVLIWTIMLLSAWLIYIYRMLYKKSMNK